MFCVKNLWYFLKFKIRIIKINPRLSRNFYASQQYFCNVFFFWHIMNAKLFTLCVTNVSQTDAMCHVQVFSLFNWTDYRPFVVTYCIIKSIWLKGIVLDVNVFFLSFREHCKKIRVKDRNCKTVLDTFPGRYWIAHTNWLFLVAESICCVFMINTVCNALCTHNSKHFYY